MLVWLRQAGCEYFKRKWFIYLFVTILFCMGIFFGATAAKVINADQAGQLSVYLDAFLEKVSSERVSEQLFPRHNVLSNLYIMIAMYILGLTVIGIPLVLAAVFTRGFILGFTVGFLVREKAFRGFIFAAISVLPHNVLIIPAVIIGGVTALSFSALLVRRRFTAKNIPIRNHFGVYTAAMLALCLITGAAGLVETYVTPVFIKKAAMYIR